MVETRRRKPKSFSLCVSRVFTLSASLSLLYTRKKRKKYTLHARAKPLSPLPLSIVSNQQQQTIKSSRKLQRNKMTTTTTTAIRERQAGAESAKVSCPWRRSNCQDLSNTRRERDTRTLDLGVIVAHIQLLLLFLPLNQVAIASGNSGSDQWPQNKNKKESKGERKVGYPPLKLVFFLLEWMKRWGPCREIRLQVLTRTDAREDTTPASQKETKHRAQGPSDCYKA